MKRSLRSRLRRHRWNAVIALGLVIGLWIGPYCYWRQKALTFTFDSVDYRMMMLPDAVPGWVNPVFEPLVRFDRAVTGEEVIVEREVFVGSIAIF